MGQKVNPHGFRVGVILDWNTRWYADKKDFANYLHRGLQDPRDPQEEVLMPPASAASISSAAPPA